MAKQRKKLSFIFEDPNTPALFAEAVRRLLIRKLSARRRDRS